MTLQHLRSGTANKRPTPAGMSDGQLAMNTNSTSPGLFLKDSAGNLVKVGPVHVGTTAPNASPATGGSAGNAVGEQWLDTSGSTYVFKIWDGSAWRSEAGEFVNATGDTMTGALVMDNQQQVRFRETTANGTNYIALQAPASVASDKTITLPDVTGTVVTTGDTGTVTSTMLLDGTIVNADVNASAAIAGTKISPDFGSQNVTTTGTSTAASFIPTSSTAPSNGVYLPAANSVAISTNGTGRLFVDASGRVTGQGFSSYRGNTYTIASFAANTTLGPLNIVQGNTGTHPSISAGQNSSGTYASLGLLTSDKYRLLIDPTGASTFTSDASTAPVIVNIGASEVARIDSSGRLGLGISSPGSLLEINSAAPSTVGTTTLLQRIRSNTGNSGFLETTSRRHTAGSDWSGVSMRLQHNVDSTLMGYLEFNPSGTSQGVAIGHNDTSRLVVDSSGRVGIGSNAPSYLLDVQGAAAVGIGAAGGNNYEFRVRAGTSGLSRFIAADTSDAGYIDYDHSGNSWIFRTNGSEACRIDSSQRLLVGTSTSIAEQFSGQARIQTAGTNYYGLASFQYANDGIENVLTIAKSRGTSVGSHVIVQSGDNLGMIRFQGSDGTGFLMGASITAAVDGTPGTNDMPGRLLFATTADGASSPTERMRIQADGKVLIGTTSAYTAAGVVNVPVLGSTTGAWTSSAGTTVSRIHMRFENTNGEVGSISTSGSATAFTTSSDYRLKENIEPITGAAARVLGLNPARFNFIADPARTVDGFIAHEVQAIVPEAIVGEKDAVDENGAPIYQSIDQSKLVPLLTAALQEALGLISDLEARIAAAGI